MMMDSLQQIDISNPFIGCIVIGVIVILAIGLQ